MRSVILAMALFLSIPLYAVVDMKNANYSETWTDINIPGSGYQLKVERVYNSRSLFNGIFGFGWCSDYETSLSSEADGGLRLTVCGGGLEVKYTAKNFDPSKTKSHYDNLIKLAAQKNSSLSKAELDRLRKDIEGNTFMRVALEQQVGFKGSSPIGKT
ncbi:MAG: cell wall-associated protein wapA, partial [Bdellovibrionales bacterium]|nr:cell wall-associated protein wapA [Bdellovibrionales bacterium]